MGRTMHGVLGAWLGLVALQAIVAQGGSGRVAGLVTTVDNLIQRAFDPNVPAIPERGQWGKSAAAPSGIGGSVGAAAAKAAQAGRQVTIGSPYLPSSRPTGPR